MTPDRTIPPPLTPAADPGDRLTRTTQAGEAVDEGKGRIFPCDGCGADLEFHIGQQQLKCPYCGYQRELLLDESESISERDYHAALARVRAWRNDSREKSSDAASELNEVRCASCGANVVFQGTLTSTACAFCDSPIQRDDVHRSEARISVDAVLPFLIEQARAAAAVKQWVSSRWFAPNEFLRRGANGRFTGVYVPYWTFDTLTFNIYHGQRGDHYWVTVGSGKNKRRVRRTRWSSRSGRFQRFFDDVLVVADRAVPRHLLQKLDPWPLGRCLPFTEQVLAGHLAKTYDIELDDGFAKACEIIEAEIRVDVRGRIGGDEQRITSLSIEHQAITYKHLLLPVWLLAYKYGGKPYRVAINGATGEVQGERPYSWVKIMLFVLTLLAVGGVIAIVAAMR